MNLTYAEAWALALALTQLAEVPVYVALARIGWARAFVPSFVTHPCVWFVFPPLGERAGLSFDAMLLVAELFAWLAEAALLRAFGVPWRRAVPISLAANAASVLLGMATRHFWGIP